MISLTVTWSVHYSQICGLYCSSTESQTASLCSLSPSVVLLPWSRYVEHAIRLRLAPVRIRTADSTPATRSRSAKFPILQAVLPAFPRLVILPALKSAFRLRISCQKTKQNKKTTTNKQTAGLYSSHTGSQAGPKVPSCSLAPTCFIRTSHVT